MKLGIENLDFKSLKNKKVGALVHPASVDQKLESTPEILLKNNVHLTCLFNPQHGFYGVKQDNMVETSDSFHSRYKIPIYSLYGKHRRPQPYMLENCDLILVDLQDVGCRIYTYITTLCYLLETGKEVWVLDRPNPLGRPIEGNFLEKEFESFVGVGRLPIRHGLTLGEAALWYKTTKNLDTALNIVKMKGYSPQKKPWPFSYWLNPSPNLPNLESCYAFSGAVLLEGTHISEARGTTRPFETFGAPYMDPFKVQEFIESYKDSHSSLKDVFLHCRLRPYFFEPVFHKYERQTCGGFHLHFEELSKVKAYRVFSIILKAIKELYPQKELFRNFHYEYEKDKLAFDLISGSEFLRKWVQDPKSHYEDLLSFLSPQEEQWAEQRKEFLLY